MYVGTRKVFGQAVALGEEPLSPALGELEELNKKIQRKNLLQEALRSLLEKGAAIVRRELQRARGESPTEDELIDAEIKRGTKRDRESFSKRVAEHYARTRRLETN
jgi:hypothetical protein